MSRYIGGSILDCDTQRPPSAREARMELDPEVFARHLDLAPLRGRRHGVVACIFHEDRTPSLSVHLDRGIFNCHGCGVGGGIKRFAELVGETQPKVGWVQPLPLIQRVANWIKAGGDPELVPVETGPSDPRFAELEGWLDLWAGADTVRRDLTLARDFRGSATRMGPYDPGTWALLTMAADLERDALNLESALSVHPALARPRARTLAEAA